MTNCLRLLAPAKLNLFLHIIGRRTDGYHLIQSAFQLIDWCDTVTLTTLPTTAIYRSYHVIGIPEEQDLTVRAAKLLQEFCGVDKGVEIQLKKEIPMGAGLGGGSSDAASVLIGLNHLWRLGLDKTTLMGLGLKLGADVPFFIYGHNAFVEGIGERLQEISLDPSQFLVIYPNSEIPTSLIFQDPELTRDHAQITISDFVASPLLGNSNDCQAVAMRVCPEVKQALDWILGEFPNSTPRMSGTGSCVFTVLTQPVGETEIANLLQKLPQGWLGRIVYGLNKNPAYNLVSSD